MTSLLNVTSPRTRSWNVTSTPSGILNRMTGRSPASIRARAHRRRGRGRCRVFRRTSGSESRLAILLELRRRAEAVVRVTAVQQLVRVGRVEMQPLGLAIRSVHAADIRAFVPVEPEPAQILEDARLGLARRSLGVGVLDAQDERAILAMREQPVEERRPRVADVELTGRARCESYAHRQYRESTSSLRPCHGRNHDSKRHRMSRDRFAPADRIDAFVGLALDADAIDRDCRARRRAARGSRSMNGAIFGRSRMTVTSTFSTSKPARGR